jgi:hypothetical protein
MFLVINVGPGGMGVRNHLLECVEKGVRALFPDSKGKFRWDSRKQRSL